MPAQKANTWLVTTHYLVGATDHMSEFWYPTEEAAETAAHGFRLGGRTAIVTKSTRNRH